MEFHRTFRWLPSSAYPDDDRLKDAVTLATKAVELDDQDALNHFAYGRALLASKAYHDALAELESAAELNPSLAVVYCGLGDSLAYEGRIEEAIPYFEKAISLSPFDPQRWAFHSYRGRSRICSRASFKALSNGRTERYGSPLSLLAVCSQGCSPWTFATRRSLADGEGGTAAAQAGGFV